MFKKIFIILCSCVIAFTSVYALPKQKADAIAFVGAVPGAITIGTGTYVLGALALSTVVGVAIGDEYGEEINAHAKKVWASGTDLAKESLNASIDLAKASGSGLMNFGSDFMDWMDDVIPSIADLMTTSTMGKPGAEMIITGTTKQFIGGSLVLNDTRFDGLHITYRGSETSGWLTFNVSNWPGIVEKQFDSVDEAKAVWGAINSVATASAMANVYSTRSFSPSFNDVEYMENYNHAVSRVRENWETMKDAGLVLPVDGATAYSGNVVMDKLNTDGTYTGIDGNIYNPGDLSWSFPVPKLRVGQGDLPGGVYVDSPAMTGNPAIDNVLVNNPAIPKTTTNVNTGVTTANPDIVTTKPEVPTIPKDPVPETVGTNPFKNLVPVALALGLFDLLVALIMYLIRMFQFILTIGFIAETPITNPYFLWFKDLKILGIKPYSMTINLAIFFLGFSIYKSVRRVFG